MPNHTFSGRISVGENVLEKQLKSLRTASGFESKKW